jgi:hypothetical protein
VLDNLEYNNSVQFRKAFSAILIVSLFVVSSWASACDLSCGFSAFRADCHSQQMATGESDASDMTMAGMTMPESTDNRSADQAAVSSVPQETPAHAALVEMGTCERQSCAQAPGLVSISIHSAAAQFEKISAVIGFPGMELTKIVFHDARDDISPPDRAVHVSLDVSLRI